MDENRRPARHLHSSNGFSRPATGDSLRAPTTDSGLGSVIASERPTTLDSRATSGTTSSLSRDTPVNEPENTVHKEHDEDRPVRIHPTSPFAHRCYEQAFVSHIDHPSAFFLQLPHSEDRYKELYEEINEFYSNKPMSDPSVKWKRGDYCIAKYNDDQFYRARIVEVPEVTKTLGLYDVVFLDYGNWNKVASGDIHSLERKFAILPAQAIPCTLTKTLPQGHTWFDHPEATKLFENLVFEQYVDATFSPKTSRDYWQLAYVDLQLSSSKLNARKVMKERNLIREVSNEEIYKEFNHLLKPVDLIIYSIRHEEEGIYDDE